MKFLINQYFFMVLFLIWGCNTNDIKLSEPTIIETQKVKSIGDTLSKKLLTALKGELSKAIQEKGVVNAIQVCNIKALPITDEIEKLVDYTVQIKRTTNKYRNPKNKPDEIEKLALEYFSNMQKDNETLPQYYIQKANKNDKEFFNYYKPLIAGPLCLACHGDPETMDKSLINILNRLYPNDLATGYKDGDFRGLLRIQVMNKN